MMTECRRYIAGDFLTNSRGDPKKSWARRTHGASRSANRTRLLLNFGTPPAHKVKSVDVSVFSYESSAFVATEATPQSDPTKTLPFRNQIRSGDVLIER